MHTMKQGLLSLLYLIAFLLISFVLVWIAVLSYSYPRSFIGCASILTGFIYLRARERWSILE